jgi:hypothetical protein
MAATKADTALFAAEGCEETDEHAAMGFRLFKLVVYREDELQALPAPA